MLMVVSSNVKKKVENFNEEYGFGYRHLDVLDLDPRIPNESETTAYDMAKIRYIYLNLRWQRCYMI